MQISSEYTFPIFISSTDYNLKDLRAELARFLEELGYKPILSSAEGFPDNSPHFEPWESCLSVLDNNTFVTVLVIDGEYGAALNWPNYEALFKQRKISPTHGEYLFCHAKKKRLFVFIRKSLMPHYQSYREALKKFNDDKEVAKKSLILPPHVSPETLDFINEVKTTKPIPWITEFEDITCIKREIQKKLLNELAAIFLLKNGYLELAITAFEKAMNSLDQEGKIEVLKSMAITKDFVTAAEKRDEYEKELSNLQSKSKDTKGVEEKIEALKKEIRKLEGETRNSYTSPLIIDDGQIKIGNPNFDLTVFASAKNLNTGVASENTSFTLTTASLFPQKICSQCGVQQKYHNPILDYSSNTASVSHDFNNCPSCGKTYCYHCWPKNNLSALQKNNSFTFGDNDRCPTCR